ncbi:MAG: outer membrane beta-barrel protein [Longimicrobiales bacterium]
MKTVLKSALVATCLLGMAAPAAAQAPGLELKLNPRVGLYVPLSDLGQATTTAGTIVADKSGSLAFGVGLELGLIGLPFNVRANVDYKTGSEVSTEGVTETLEPKMLAIAGDLVFRPLPKLIIIQPYVFVGGGLRQYDFDTENTQALEDASDPTVHLGGGLDLTLGPLALNAEIGDYISWYEIQADADAEMQHDMFVSVGIVLGLL